MKDYPKGWKPKKPRKPRLPIPPPGQVHDSRKDYNRQDNRKAIEAELEDECDCGEYDEYDPLAYEGKNEASL